MTAAVATQQIVIPIDVAGDSSLALESARKIAHSGDEVTFIHSIPLLATSGVLLPKSISADDVARDIREEARRQLATIVADAQMPDGVRVRSIIVDGDPGEEIVNYASRPDISMIVMETTGKGAAKRMMIGSVADHIARSSSVPVLLIRDSTLGARSVAQFRRIVVPIDSSERSQLALPYAAELALRLSVPIHLITVIAPNPSSYLYGVAFSLAASDEIATTTLRQTRSMLKSAELTLTQPGIEVTSALLSGTVAPTIERSLLPGDLVVMASHGRSGVRRWLLGSVAEHLVRHGDAPVLLVPATDLPLSGN